MTDQTQVYKQSMGVGPTFKFAHHNLNLNGIFVDIIFGSSKRDWTLVLRVLKLNKIQLFFFSHVFYSRKMQPSKDVQV